MYSMSNCQIYFMSWYIGFLERNGPLAIWKMAELFLTFWAILSLVGECFFVSCMRVWWKLSKECVSTFQIVMRISIKSSWEFVYNHPDHPTSTAFFFAWWTNQRVCSTWGWAAGPFPMHCRGNLSRIIGLQVGSNPPNRAPGCGPFPHHHQGPVLVTFFLGSL